MPVAPGIYRLYLYYLRWMCLLTNGIQKSLFQICMKFGKLTLNQRELFQPLGIIHCWVACWAQSWDKAISLTSGGTDSTALFHYILDIQVLLECRNTFQLRFSTTNSWPVLINCHRRILTITLWYYEVLLGTYVRTTVVKVISIVVKSCFQDLMRANSYFIDATRIGTAWVGICLFDVDSSLYAEVCLGANADDVACIVVGHDLCTVVVDGYIEATRRG